MDVHSLKRGMQCVSNFGVIILMTAGLLVQGDGESKGKIRYIFSP